jgi:hypothetical protein
MTSKKIAIVTGTRFWLHGTGLWTRINSLIAALSSKSELHVIFLGGVTESDKKMLNQSGYDFKFSWLGVLRESGQTVSKEMLQQYWVNQFQEMEIRKEIDTYIVIQTELSFFLDALPKGAQKLVDMQDLICRRTATRKRFNVQDAFALTAKEEKAILSKYDGVIAIQKHEYQQVVNWFGVDKCVYAPQPFQLNSQRLRKEVKNIGILASEAPANIHGIHYFIESVWPMLESEGFTLSIYGRVARAMTSNNEKIIFHGFKQDLAKCYQEIDIAINPVFYGAGLKIKSLEAMAHGMPLVTSIEGMRGFEEMSGEAFLHATSPQQFAQHILLLANDFEKRQSIVSKALEFIENEFNQKTAFKQLFSFLEV